jgi:nitrogen fixation protein FixH
MTNPPLDHPHPHDGRRFFWMVFSFFIFLTIVFVGFAYIATSTHRGVVTENAYQKGLDYNEVVAADTAQEALGWSGAITYAAPTLSYKLLNSQETPIVNASVVAYFSFVGGEGYDFQVPLISEGTKYLADITFPVNGQWDIRISSTWHNTPYQQHARILVK